MGARLVRTQPDWWAALSEGFFRALGRRGRRPNTTRAYGFELRDFGAWLGQAAVGSLAEITRQHLEEWQDDLQRRKAPRTQLVAASAVRGLLKWAAKSDMALSSPALWLHIEERRAPRLLPRPIPLRDLLLICAHLAQPSGELEDLRTRALFWTILSSGARISEALSLTRMDVLGESALVTQKGGSLHQLMISAAAREATVDYLRAREDADPALFVSTRHPLTVLSKKEAQRGWTLLCRRLRIARFTSHQIRHSCATELLRQGVNHIVIAKHMGHRDLTTIQGYAEVAVESRLVALQTLDQRFGFAIAE